MRRAPLCSFALRRRTLHLRCWLVCVNHHTVAHGPSARPPSPRQLKKHPCSVQSTLPCCSDAEVLSMFAMIINRLRGKMETEVGC